MKLKTIEVNGSTYAEVQDGKPLYEHEDGKVLPYDAVHSAAKIRELNAEAKKHREAKEAIESQVKEFEGLDPEAARKALETVGNLDAKRLIDAGEVEKFKSDTKAAFDRQFKEAYEPVARERDELKATLDRERLNVAFSRSKYVAEKLAIPADLAQAAFGSRFTPEGDGRFVAKGLDGNPLYSRSKPGETPDFDEALELLVDSYPYRDQILKGSGASGGGANGSRTGAGGKRQVPRAQFDAMSPAERVKAAAEAEIVD